MSVKIKKIVCLLILGSLAVACSTTSESSKKASVSVPKSKTTLIDNKGAAFGISTPEWVELADRKSVV